MKKSVILLLLFTITRSFAQNANCLLPEGTRFDVLTKPGELNKQSNFRIGPNGQLYLIANGVCIDYFDSKATILAFPPDFKVNEIYWLESGDCLFSDSTSVYLRIETSDSVFRVLHTDMKHLCFTPSRFGIYFYERGGTELHFLSYSDAEARKVCNFASSITDIEPFAEDCFVAFGNNVGVIINNEKYVSLFNNSTPVTSIAVGPDGILFYGTAEGLLYYNYAERQFQICNIGVRELLSYDNDLYVCFLDNSSACIHGVSAYSEIAKMMTKKKDNGFGITFLGKSVSEKARGALKNNHIEIAIAEYDNSIQQMQDNRSSGSGVNGDLIAEFAYALALHHDFEAAIVNIDRARLLNAKHGDFYSAQVLTLMGYDDAAQQLMRQAKVPEWIDGIYQELNKKYKTNVSIIRDTPQETLKRANILAANKQTIQAMELFEELIKFYKEDDVPYIIYVDYSTVWESQGYYTYAGHLLQKGIDLMPQDQNENKQIFQNHLTKVNQMKASFENASWLKRLLGLNPPKLMTYVGASAAKDMYSLNGRMGVYTSNKFSASVNVGLNYASKEFSGSLGFSAYKAWGIFVGGLGVTDMFGKESNTFSLTPSIGLSFLDKNQTSSFDIMVNGYIPFSSDQKFTYSISIGKTIYFDLNGLLK